MKILPLISLEENITNEEGLQNMSQLDSFSTTKSSKSTEGSLTVFQERCKIESQSQESKISRKVTCSEKIPEFVKLLKHNVFFWKNIQNKLNCMEAISSDGETATIHIEWSENVHIRQAWEEKSAYYF